MLTKKSKEHKAPVTTKYLIPEGNREQKQAVENDPVNSFKTVTPDAILHPCAHSLPKDDGQHSNLSSAAAEFPYL